MSSDSPWLGLEFEPPQRSRELPPEPDDFDDADGYDDFGDVLDEREGKGDRAEVIVRRFLRLCEGERTGPRMMKLVRGFVDGEAGAKKRYAMLNRFVLNPMVQRSGGHMSAMRMELIASQLVGLAMMRYVLKVEPVSSASIEEIVEKMAPAIRATLKNKSDG